MKKLDESKIASDKSIIYLMEYSEKFRVRNSQKKIKKINNNVCPLKPEFRKYVPLTSLKDKSNSTAKSVFISTFVICIWCFAMLLLAKASHQFLKEICLHTVQQINLNRE
jgi:hypothetical protein